MYSAPTVNSILVKLPLLLVISTLSVGSCLFTNSKVISRNSGSLPFLTRISGISPFLTVFLSTFDSLILFKAVVKLSI